MIFNSTKYKKSIRRKPSIILRSHVYQAYPTQGLHSSALLFSNKIFLQVLLLSWTWVMAFPLAIYNHTYLSKANWSIEKLNMMYSRSTLQSVEKP